MGYSSHLWRALDAETWKGRIEVTNESKEYGHNE